MMQETKADRFTFHRVVSNLPNLTARRLAVSVVVKQPASSAPFALNLLRARPAEAV